MTTTADTTRRTGSPDLNVLLGDTYRTRAEEATKDVQRIMIESRTVIERARALLWELTLVQRELAGPLKSTFDASTSRLEAHDGFGYATSALLGIDHLSDALFDLAMLASPDV